MRKKRVVFGTVLTLCIVFGAGVFAGAATSSAEPGSSGDPLITKSYLEERLSEIQNIDSNNSSSNSNDQTSADLSELQKQIDELEAENSALKKQLTTVEAEAKKGSFKKVTVKKGKTLIVKYGAEVVFYSGTGKWKTSNDQYILDVTLGEHVKNGTSAVLYHNYLIRSGSNLEASKDMVVYVRGTYSVK